MRNLKIAMLVLLLVVSSLASANPNKNPPQKLCSVYLGIEICIIPPKDDEPIDPLPPCEVSDTCTE